jgi:hypothetical protein
MMLKFKIWVKPTPESKPTLVGETSPFEYPGEPQEFIAHERWRMVNNWKEAYPHQAETAVFEFKLYRVDEEKI